MLKFILTQLVINTSEQLLIPLIKLGLNKLKHSANNSIDDQQLDDINALLDVTQQEIKMSRNFSQTEKNEKIARSIGRLVSHRVHNQKSVNHD